MGKPAGWIADRLPFDDWTDDALAFLEDEDVGDAGGFDAGRPGSAGRGVPTGAARRRSIRPSSARGRSAPASSGTLLVTGDSLVDAARHRAGAAPGRATTEVKVERDPHIGTGISKTGLVDWGRLSTAAGCASASPTAVVVFIGANEGFPMPGRGGEQIECCGPDWAAEYAYRVRRMMNTYRRGGRARVYWLTLPAPRDGDRPGDRPRGERRHRGGRPALPRAGARARHGRAVHPRTAATATP